VRTQNAQTPTLQFFHETPRDWLSHPPLASSLQNFETSLILLAMSCYPSALVTSASAIESAVQAAFPRLRGKRFEELLKNANSGFPIELAFDSSDLDSLRRKRNEIIHFGFNHNDDEVAAALLIETGYRFIEQCYETYFDFRLKGKGTATGALRRNLDKHLEVAQIVYQRTKNIQSVRATLCFLPLAHEIRWHLRSSLLSNWEATVLELEDEEFERRWSLQEREKNTLARKTFEASWDFDCPICDYPDALVCELDAHSIKKREIHLNRAVCVSCGFEIPNDCPTLADELCGDQLVEARPFIFDEFGIEGG
jgi:hypothetical protein